MLVAERNSAEVKKGIERDFKWGVLNRTHTIFDYTYDIFTEAVSREVVFETEFITSKLKDGRIRIFTSLSQTGYYYFICKLTVHFLRLEPQDTVRDSLK
ncbi:MAG: hypothetical protein ABH952_12650 [Candidatus Omnitrophota bacterium]